MRLFVRWRVYREADIQAKENCAQEICRVVTERVNEVGRDSLLSDKMFAKASRQLYRLKKQAKGYSLICDTRTNIESHWKQESITPTHTRCWGPVIELPSSQQTCSACGGNSHYTGGAGGVSWNCPVCSGIGTVTVDNSYYLVIAERR